MMSNPAHHVIAKNIELGFFASHGTHFSWIIIIILDIMYSDKCFPIYKRQQWNK